MKILLTVGTAYYSRLFQQIVVDLHMFYLQGLAQRDV